MTHEDAWDALPIYALGLLDAPDRDALRAHLGGCAVCQIQLQEEQRAVDALGRGVEQVRPRRELRTRVLASIDPSRAASAPPRVAVARMPRWQWAALAAAASLALLMGVGLLRARAEIAELRAAVLTWQVRVADADQRVAQASTEVTSQRRAVAVLVSSDLVQATLEGVPPAGSARARAFLSLSQGTLILSAQGLPPPPSGHVYQLWAIVGNRAVSAGLFTPDASGRGQIVGRLPTLDGQPAALAVTLEPEGGVDQPTGAKYLLGTTSN